jgi:hypothetical protein
MNLGTLPAINPVDGAASVCPAAQTVAEDQQLPN